MLTSSGYNTGRLLVRLCLNVEIVLRGGLSELKGSHIPSVYPTPRSRFARKSCLDIRYMPNLHASLH